MKDNIRFRYIASLFSRAYVSRFCIDNVCAEQTIKMHAEKARIPMGNTDIKAESFFDRAYKELVCNYRSEYVYKNAIADKIIRARYRLSKSCYFGSEFRVFDSKADIVIANGTTTAYEIKTEFDSLERLDKQISDYSKVFEYVYVVIPSSKISIWYDQIPKKAGVISLTENYTLRKERKALSNIDNLDASVVFSCLKRSEIINFTKNFFGDIPDVKPVDLKSACKNLFLTLENRDVHEALLLSLKSRGISENSLDLVRVGPRSLTSIFLSSNFTRKEKLGLLRFLMD